MLLMALQIFMAAVLAAIPALACGLLAALIHERANPHDPMGPGLGFVVITIIAYIPSLWALLRWALSARTGVKSG